MGKKVFISYKYGDANVQPLKDHYAELFDPTKVRDYVTAIQEVLLDDHINKGEADEESLENFEDETIASKLRDKIYDSSVTIVVISPNMKNPLKKEEDQWIPWEVAYSLREKTREERTSRTNAVLAVVLPDRNGSYSYFIEDRKCCEKGCRLYKTDTLFSVLKKNMFSRKQNASQKCNNNSLIHYGEYSYILSAKWSEFKASPDNFIERAIKINENIDDYDITKVVV
jgi:hypothetical protein